MNIKRMGVTTGSLLALAVLFVALTVISNALFRGARVDLTENNLYTLSDGTRNILAEIDEPIQLYFFFSEQVSQDLPWLRTYANRVQELLEEFSAHADGRLNLHLIDPQPFSEEEDRAAGFGLQAVPVGTGETLYFGLAGTNTLDGVETIPFFQPEKEAFLEYDLSKLVYSLAHPEKPVIGLLSTLPLQVGFDPMTRQMRQPWVITEQLSQLFDIRSLDPGVSKIDDDIDVLMLVHPKSLGATTLYAIDQFVLRGGKALVFVDPQSEAEAQLSPPGDPSAMFAPRSSNLERLFESWGISMNANEVVGDSRYALSVSLRPGQAPTPHLGILSVDRNGLARDDVATAELSTVNFALSGYIQQREGAATQLLPLLESSAAAMPIAADRVRFLPNPGELHQGFAPTGTRYILAGRIHGKVKTAFPDGAPATEDTADESGQSGPSNSEHLSESSEPINVIVVADTDMLSDRLWVQTTDFFGQRIASAWANNGDFVVNSLDNLTGNSDLISIRGQAVSTRPFTTVDAIAREANARFLATEQELEAQLRETEERLSQLQRSRNDANSLILSPEQRTELERFQQKKLEIRKQLRQVRHELDQDIERLGTTLKIINIGLMPLLLSIFALTAWWLRNQKRKTAQKEALS